MNVTFLLPYKTLSDEWISNLINLPAKELYDYLTKLSLDNPYGITRKIGNGSFRDKVEWNQVMRTAIIPSPIISKRRGYQLVNYEIHP